MSAYLYVLHAGGFVKVGVSKDPPRRVSQLQGGCPFPITVIGQWWMTNPYELEAELHRQLEGFHSHGEWFRAAKNVMQGIAWQVAGIASRPNMDDDRYVYDWTETSPLYEKDIKAWMAWLVQDTDDVRDRLSEWADHRAN